MSTITSKLKIPDSEWSVLTEIVKGASLPNEYPDHSSSIRKISTDVDEKYKGIPYKNEMLVLGGFMYGVAMSEMKTFFSKARDWSFFFVGGLISGIVLTWITMLVINAIGG